MFVVDGVLETKLLRIETKLNADGNDGLVKVSTEVASAKDRRRGRATERIERKKGRRRCFYRVGI